MQTLAAYVIFLLIVVASGLAIILAAILILAMGEVLAWLQTLHAFRSWQEWVLNAVRNACTLLNNQVTVLAGNLHFPHFHAKQ